MKGGPGRATRAMEKAGRDLGAAVRKDDPEAILVSAYLLTKDGKARPALTLLKEHGDLCAEHGDLAYMRGEAEVRAGLTPLGAVRARRWLRQARTLGVSGSVDLRPARTSAQALILLGPGLVLAVLGASLKSLRDSWRALLVVAGAAVSSPALLRHFAVRVWWALVLVVVFVTLLVVALS